jgi:hypothetical protein
VVWIRKLLYESEKIGMQVVFFAQKRHQLVVVITSDTPDEEALLGSCCYHLANALPLHVASRGWGGWLSTILAKHPFTANSKVHRAAASMQGVAAFKFIIFIHTKVEVGLEFETHLCPVLLICIQPEPGKDLPERFDIHLFDVSCREALDGCVVVVLVVVTIIVVVTVVFTVTKRPAASGVARRIR